MIKPLIQAMPYRLKTTSPEGLSAHFRPFVNIFT